MADKFLIAPISEGLRRDTKPWLIPENAFEELNNAYIFRGRIRNRIGSMSPVEDLLDDPSAFGSRLRIKLGTTNGAGTIPPGVVPGTVFKVGQMFSIGSDSFTVFTAGLQPMLKTGAATTYTFNTATGAYDIQGSIPATDVYFYPAEPVMGFHNYEKIEINNENTYAFDTQFAYQLLATGWSRLATGGAAAIWTGSDSQFFWSTTWRGVNDHEYTMFTTNYNAADQLRYWDGTTWTTWNPQYGPNAFDTIESARLIIPFKNRLLLFNTIESFDATAATRTYANRLRYSADTTDLNVFNAGAWRQDTHGAGGFREAPIKEAIVSAQILNDRLIVFFERSVYEVVYTTVQERPFVWREISSEGGCESTFSTVLFDDVILGIGQSGIYGCNGRSVERVDDKIPDEVFKFHNNDDSVYRVHGIRDKYNEVVYWTVPDKAKSTDYCDRLLVFNYKNGAWAYFDDIVTAFGFYQLVADETWQEDNQQWQDDDTIWSAGEDESKFKFVIAGNLQGYTFIMDRGFHRNAKSQQITNILEAAGVVTITSINHNLSSGDWIQITNAEGIVELNEGNYRVKRVDANTFTIDYAPAVTGAYTGGGTIALVSKVDIYTKEFNFYVSQGLNVSIESVDFHIDKVEDGYFLIDYLPSSSNYSLRKRGIDTGAILGNATLEMGSYGGLEDVQHRLWHTVYMQAQGEFIKLRIYWSNAVMSDSVTPFKPFQIHAMLFNVSPTQTL